MSTYMKTEFGAGRSILVIADVEEMRDGIEQLLRVNGFHVEAVRNERAAVESALRRHPDLILISVGRPLNDVVATARQVREGAALAEAVPVVLFSIAEIAEGEEVAIGQNIYLTRPDNFNQLRAFLARLLQRIKGIT
jgi:DNA-binding response OmpR family regulator